MGAPSSVTFAFDAVLASTMYNYAATVEDNISKKNAFYYHLKKQKEGWVGLTDVGERASINLMYALGSADSYSGYDTLDTNPMDGFTKAFFEWAQGAVPISISGREELINTSKSQIFDLMKGKITQAELGIIEFFSRALLQGNGPNSATAITTPYTSPVNGSLFIEPLPKLVAFDPTASVVVGNINQSTYSWWQNKYKHSAATTYAGFLKEMRGVHRDCSKGAGGAPNLFVCDELYFSLYEAALAAAHRNPSYQKADIPFDNIEFKGKPLVWDEFVPDAHGGTITGIPVSSSGTCYYLNTQFWQVKYHKARNFSTTQFQKPANQDAKVAHILWFGAAMCGNRAKQGVHSAVDTTIVA